MGVHVPLNVLGACPLVQLLPRYEVFQLRCSIDPDARTSFARLMRLLQSPRTLLGLSHTSCLFLERMMGGEFHGCQSFYDSAGTAFCCSHVNEQEQMIEASQKSIAKHLHAASEHAC
jgi:hypothetical protein